ncbi:glycosyltransferase family 2 protein [Pedobacter ginsengisoli]|uniref:glycosyltransferase family 2 protein n=1 Tax=Pedobacter ginsengisoli TaxID=363852 RepID=UPI00254C734D|nr:glycosyltransferase family 2 protein [Pedobacter ginsengisoli]
MSNQPIKSPTRIERFTLRLMISLGVIGMIFFLRSLIDPDVIGNIFLYYLLITSIVFGCLTTLHEWYHYYHITVPKTPSGTRRYTVDIFTTFCAGEPYEMIEETLIAIKNITYPHETYLCDEANDPHLIQLCKNLNVHHVTRTLKVNAKAGNINNALKVSCGELCVILDPDHVPFPNFLDPIVSHFDNPEIGYVQIVQAYKNHIHGLIAKGAAQQTYQFYGPMMMTMNKYGTVLAIGANCTFRRTALESIGGHAPGLAEDMHTAMQLHAKGWKSVYVPEVLARGLVPTTLSAYYSQQLKWSRGVFELLVATFPKLYKQFTWRQKLHYFTIPFHYLSGLFFFMNFMIPILALVFSLSPLKMDIQEFCIVGLPFFAAVLLIRHFVQWWVMEDEERGFHVVGGLLMIGTWWIYIIGLFYTILRKKVPYNPTPKDGNEANNWPLNIPNLTIIALSVFAVIYGLYSDFNPYNLIMSGFAVLNCFILSFTVLASRQIQFRMLRSRFQALDQFMYKVHLVKKALWLIRHRVYTGIRSTALLITILITCLIVYSLNNAHEKDQITARSVDEHRFYYGIFSPGGTNGLSSLKQVRKEQANFNTHFDIISLYVPWGDGSNYSFPLTTLDSIYKNGSLPMITWEPWQSLFGFHQKEKGGINETMIFQKIVHGNFDAYLKRFSTDIKKLKRPVYIRFAHEADNPFYPWSEKGGNSAADFKDAWRYVHNFFSRDEVVNVIWVWNPWKAEAVQAYFPGRKYVDWIGVTNLNYGSKASGANWVSMEDLYRPFHKQPIFRSGLPVMLAEMGTDRSAGRQNQWFNDALISVKKKFPEVRALVLFNSGLDVNIPDGGNAGVIDWRIEEPAAFKKLFTYGRQPADTGQLTSMPVNRVIKNIITPQKHFSGFKGVNYTKGLNWYKSKHPFRKRELVEDFKEIKSMGLNAVRRFGPGIYDFNLFKAAKQTDMKILYCFWVPEDLDFSKQETLEKLTTRFVGTVSKLKDKKEIISWNISNPVFQKLGLHGIKPESIYQQDRYLVWLKDLVNKIRHEDQSRKINVDINFSEDFIQIARRIKTFIPEIDSFGLLIKASQSADIKKMIGEFEYPYYYAEVDDAVLYRNKLKSEDFFVTNWQDEATSDWVKLNGLKDLSGRRKVDFFKLKAYLQGSAVPKLPEVKILRPARSTEENALLRYQAVIKAEGKWVPASNLSGLKFEWKLVTVDRFRNPIAIKDLGESSSVEVTIPADASSCRLFLYVISGEAVTTVSTSLNTPLYELEKEIKY